MTRLTMQPIEQVTEHQLKVLKRLANSQAKTYCAPAGTPADKRQDEINEHFNSILRLVEIGLMCDLSDSPKFRPLIDQYMHDEGRDVVVVAISVGGNVMFKRNPWQKWIN